MLEINFLLGKRLAVFSVKCYKKTKEKTIVEMLNKE